MCEAIPKAGLYMVDNAMLMSPIAFDADDQSANKQGIKHGSMHCTA